MKNRNGLPLELIKETDEDEHLSITPINVNLEKGDSIYLNN